MHKIFKQRHKNTVFLFTGFIASGYKVKSQWSTVNGQSQRLPYFRGEDVNADVVLAAHGDDDVREALGGLDEEFVHGFHEGSVVADGFVEAASAFDDIAADDADEAFVGVGVDKHLDIHRIAQFRICEHEDALHDEHFGGMHGDGLLATAAGDIRISGHGNGFTSLEPLDVLDHQGKLNGRGMVEVDFLFLLLREVAIVAIVRVLRQHADVMFGELVDDFLNHGGFSRAGSAGDT